MYWLQRMVQPHYLLRNHLVRWILKEDLKHLGRLLCHPKLPSPKEQNPPPTLEVTNIFQEMVKENEEANLEDGII